MFESIIAKSEVSRWEIWQRDIRATKYMRVLHLQAPNGWQYFNSGTRWGYALVFKGTSETYDKAYLKETLRGWDIRRITAVRLDGVTYPIPKGYRVYFPC